MVSETLSPFHLDHLQLIDSDAGGYGGVSGVAGEFGAVNDGAGYGSGAVATGGEDSWAATTVVSTVAPGGEGGWGNGASAAQTGW